MIGDASSHSNGGADHCSDAVVHERSTVTRTPRKPPAKRAGVEKNGPAARAADAKGAALPRAVGGRVSASTIWIAASAAAAALIIAGLALLFLTGIPVLALFGGPRMETAAAAFVGSETCAGCHQGEAQLWRGSQHRLAMQHASDKTVLGDFSGATFDYHGVHSRFFRRDDKFFVETDGPDGKLAAFEVKYTFGV